LEGSNERVVGGYLIDKHCGSEVKILGRRHMKVSAMPFMCV